MLSTVIKLKPFQNETSERSVTQTGDDVVNNCSSYSQATVILAVFCVFIKYKTVYTYFDITMVSLSFIQKAVLPHNLQ